MKIAPMATLNVTGNRLTISSATDRLV